MKLKMGSVLRSIVRESFFDFVKEFWGVVSEEPPHWNWHIEYLCSELQREAIRVRERRTREWDWACNIPPGMSKSTIISQMFPAWVWLDMPWAQFLCMSYSFSVAQKDSLKTRDIVTSEKYKQVNPGLELRPDANTKGLFVNSRKGYRMAAGVGGAVTGHHGHFLLVDDPLNPEQSYSEAELRGVNRWMRTTLPTRRLPKDIAPILLIQQRLSQMDPTGEMLERYAGKGLRHICLPGEITEEAIVSPPELRERYVDGLLDPVRLSRDVLAQAEQDLGPYGYAGQILQQPIPLGGGMFETAKINYVQEVPQSITWLGMVRSWDKAGTKDAGAFTAGVKIGLDREKRPWILDVHRGQWAASKREQEIQLVASRDGYSIPVIVEVEGGSGGKESGEHTVSNLVGHTIRLYHPTGDKVARAAPLASQMGVGNVFVLNRHWTKDFVEELKHFPFGKYKDQVDAASGGFNFITRKKKKVGALW